MLRMVIIAVFLLLPQTQKHRRIEVGEDRLLSASGPALPLVESQLSTNPINPKQLFAVVTQFGPPRGSNASCISWSSFDGGRSWIRRRLPIQCSGDPWGAILPDGSAVMVVLGHVDGHEDNAFLFRSPDGGRTWPNAPLGVGAHQDHPMVIAHGNDVYVASGGGLRNSAGQHRDTVSIAHSQDGGRTFGPPTNVIASNLGYQAEGPAVLSDGTFVVGFHDYVRQGSATWLLRPRSWMLRSSDHGRTFSEPLLISESCNSLGGWPSMAVDGDNRLFWTCIADKFNGVLVQRSDDRGDSWSEPVRVNHSEKADSFTPSIAVNKDGVVGVSWYEIHDKNCFDLYFTASLDHGKSYLPEAECRAPRPVPTRLRIK